MPTSPVSLRKNHVTRRHITSPATPDGFPDNVNMNHGKKIDQNTKVPNMDQLIKYEDVPHYLKYPFITKGYRCQMSFSQCFKSMFVWSNESVNVWTHLGGCIIFTFLNLYDNLVLLPAYQASLIDHIVLSISLCCFQCCLFFSGGYHLFNCHSEYQARQWLAFDLAGISLGLMGCYLPGIHYIFYCLKLWRFVYLLVACLLFVTVIKFQTSPSYTTKAWFIHRLLTYCGLLSYGIIPSIHWIYLNGEVSGPFAQLIVPKVVTIYSLFIFAFIFYISKLPERCFEGCFDYVGASHQVWHLLIFSCFVFWRHAEHDILQYCINTPCTT